MGSARIASCVLNMTDVVFCVNYCSFMYATVQRQDSSLPL